MEDDDMTRKKKPETTTGDTTEKQGIIQVSSRRRAYFATPRDDGKWTLGIATENESGYHLTKEDSDLGGAYRDEDDARRTADAANEGLGISPREAAMIVASSIMVSDVRLDDDTIRRRPLRKRSKAVEPECGHGGCAMPRGHAGGHMAGPAGRKA